MRLDNLDRLSKECEESNKIVRVFAIKIDNLLNQTKMTLNRIVKDFVLTES